MSIVVAILALVVVITLHELGHFVAARALGVGVLRFSIGFGPVLWSWRSGGTEYCVSAVPLGAYVQMVGEDAPSAVGTVASDAFNVKPRWARAIIVAAGPVANLATAWVLYAVVFSLGIPVLTSAVGEVKSDLPAAAAGIAKGDRILSVDGQPTGRWEELSAAIRESAGRPIVLEVQHGEKTRRVELTPKQIEGATIFGEPIPSWVIGVGPSGAVLTERLGPIDAIFAGFTRTGEVIGLTVMSLVKLVQRVVPASSLGGPIMIVKMAGDQAQEGVAALLAFMAILSVNLGVLNLFPIPVLDGGQLLFLGIEGVTRRPLGAKARDWAMQVGLVLLVSLMGFALFNDLQRLVTG